VIIIALFAAFAVWWNPFTLFSNGSAYSAISNNADSMNQINALNKKISALEAQINALTAAKTTTTSSATIPNPSNSDSQSGQNVQTNYIPPSPQPNTISANTVDYSQYSSLPLDFSKNPPYYTGINVQVKGTVVDFLANGDKGRGSNYIEINPSSVQSSPLSSIMLKVSASDYMRAVASLNAGDLITAYGTVASSEQFSNQIGIINVIPVPVVNAIRIDKCNTSVQCTVNIGSRTVLPYVQYSTANNSNYVTISGIYRAPNNYTHTQISTEGKVTQILNSPRGGEALVLLQDSTVSSGLIALEVNLAFISNNNIHNGSLLEVTGTLLPSSDSTVSNLYSTYELASPNNTSYYIDSGTVTITN